MCCILKEDDCKKLLIRKFGREDINFVSFKIKPISALAQGFTGEHNKLDIICELDKKEIVEKFFLKTKPMKVELLKEMAPGMNIYQHEIFIYDILFQEFDKYGLNTSFAPKCFYCISAKGLILEDMILAGYQMPERQKMFDLEQTKCGLKALAQLHGSGFLYEEIKYKELGSTFRLNQEYSQYLNRDLFYTNPTEVPTVAMKWIKAAIDGYLGLIDYLPESEEFRKEFKKRLQAKEIGKIFYEDTKIRKTLGHGDLWSNNMFFKSENGIPQKCCLVDYQMVRYFYPAHDVILFIYTNTSRDFRKQHLTELLHYYYNCLSNVVAEHGFAINDIHSKEDFEQSYEIVEFDAKLYAASVHSYWCCSAEMFSEKVNSGGTDWDDFLFGDRKMQLKRWFELDENFRNLMTDAMYELHNTLFKA